MPSAVGLALQAQKSASQLIKAGANENQLAN